ncbi:MAG: hypothetical protein ABGX83_08670 [Nitrospira sp.]
MDGQLGDGTTFDSSTPVTVVGISDAISIGVGFRHSCAVISGGKIKCWGFNFFGQLENGTSNSSSTPVLVDGISNAVSISLGRLHTCALLTGGSLKCWGDNNAWQLGSPIITPSGLFNFSSVPLLIEEIIDAVDVASGANHSCALIVNGMIECWGINFFGELGNRIILGSHVPVNVTGISTATSISATLFHNCARLSDGTIKCWGNNQFGQLGNGTTTNSISPVDVMKFQ